MITLRVEVKLTMSQLIALGHLVVFIGKLLF